MAEIEAYAKKWGSSLGIIIPKEVVDKEHITPKTKIAIEIKKSHTAREVWGMLQKGWKHTTQDLKNEARKGWD